MWAGFELITDNLGIGLPNLLLLLGTLAGFIAMAKDFKYGLILVLMLSASAFIYLYAKGLNWLPALAVMMVTIVMMAFSLYFVNKTSGSAGGVI